MGEIDFAIRHRPGPPKKGLKSNSLGEGGKRSFPRSRHGRQRPGDETEYHLFLDLDAIALDRLNWWPLYASATMMRLGSNGATGLA